MFPGSDVPGNFLTQTKHLTTVKIMKELFDSIKQVEFPADQYRRETHQKTQIVIHHTAGWDNARGVFEWWKSNPQRIATCCAINDYGLIYQGFGSEFWGYHLGAGNPELDMHSIGVEICNWGWLEKVNGKFYSYTKAEVPAEKVVSYVAPFRGHHHWERYTDKEIESLKMLLQYWRYKYDIPLTYRDEMWDVSPKALAGEPGVWTHVSYRKDKFDCHPQPELIAMFKSL